METKTVGTSRAISIIKNYSHYESKIVVDTPSQDLISVRTKSIIDLLQTYKDKVNWKIYLHDDKEQIVVSYEG